MRRITRSGLPGVLLVAWAVLFAGCGYSSRRLTEVEGARTIAVSTFANAGYRRDLERRLTQAVLAALRSTTSYAIAAPESADLVISGRMSAEESVINLDENDNPVQIALRELP